MTNQEIIEILVAHSNGKQIQIRRMGTQQGFRDGKWYDVENPRWNFEDNDFRVKPEPREWWVCDGWDHDNWQVIPDKIIDLHRKTCSGEKVRVREVI